MFTIIAGLLIGLLFVAWGVRTTLNATEMARRREELIALCALTEGMPATSRFAPPPVFIRCVGVLSALVGTTAALIAVAALTGAI
ncbi:hypothetical protein K388_00376 [Streptomyces sp. KhCrAH-43]|uniref:hypothetical protein n=1 Tax=Streptomyces TaxID=1883 RepID=UPI000362446D|nr:MULTISPECIES: hypothetical protein [unclassified Streptomyces]MYS37964.1 hypothetical protein [Streptomyces sp. SID4920]MYX66151.1 hypothetical protein [Streptomyces sp. SID8373]RAJ67635.1 hypothetical protein K388_00376 [Streptomyces sp. KhCrAH-43]